MQSRHPNQPLEQDPEANEEEEGVDLERIKEIAGFVLRAPRRRPVLAAAVFVLGAAAGIGVAVTMPRTYNSQVKLLAQANIIVPALTERRVPREADSPTKDLADQILRRDNLLALMKETNLVERYYAQRSPALKFKDKLLGGSGTDDDRQRVVVGTLEKNLTVSVQDSNVTIGVDWYDPKLAYELVTTVQKNFQSARYDADVAMITDAVSLLQDHAKIEADAVDAALEEYRKVIVLPALAASASPRAVPRAPRPVVAARGVPTPAALQEIDPDLADALEEKREQIRSLEGQRQRDLESLRGQLAQAQLTLTPQHPTVIALQQKVDALSVPDPRLAQLKADERALMATIAPPVPSAKSAPSVPPPVLAAPVAPSASVDPIDPLAPVPMATTLGTVKEDPQVQLIRAKLDAAIRRYQDAVWRIDGANMEVEIARAAFKYRYTVVTPAEVPTKPKKAIATMVGIGSVIGSLVLAFILAAAADLGSGRVLEEWQVRRRLKLEILGEFEAKALPPGSA